MGERNTSVPSRERDRNPSEQCTNSPIEAIRLSIPPEASPTPTTNDHLAEMFPAPLLHNVLQELPLRRHV